MMQNIHMRRDGNFLHIQEKNGAYCRHRIMETRDRRVQLEKMWKELHDKLLKMWWSALNQWLTFGDVFEFL